LELHEEPDIIREDPYGIGWLLLIDPSDPDEELSYLLREDEALNWWKSEMKLRHTRSNSA
jgi:glycine cleavage system H lipoate-binding protein